MTLGEKPRTRGDARRCDRFRQADHLDRAGAVRQAAMKPRSSSALISRWMPDFERRSSASFISSKEGGTPGLLQPLVDEHEQFMLLARQHGVPGSIFGIGTNHEQTTCSICVPQSP